MTNGEKVKNILSDNAFSILVWLITVTFAAGITYAQFYTHQANKDIHWTSMERMNTFLPRCEWTSGEKHIQDQIGAAHQSLIRIENKIDDMQTRNVRIDKVSSGPTSDRSTDMASE